MDMTVRENEEWSSQQICEELGKVCERVEAKLGLINTSKVFKVEKDPGGYFQVPVVKGTDVALTKAPEKEEAFSLERPKDCTKIEYNGVFHNLSIARLFLNRSDAYYLAKNALFAEPVLTKLAQELMDKVLAEKKFTDKDVLIGTVLGSLKSPAGNYIRETDDGVFELRMWSDATVYQP